jgi:hypothetical protein
MSENIRPFTSLGGDKNRINRQLVAAGFEPEEVGFEFRNIDTEPVSFVVSAWDTVCADNNLIAVPISPESEYDGVGIADEASPAQVKQSLVYHYRQIGARDTVEDRQDYWNKNPVIYRYLQIAKGE